MYKVDYSSTSKVIASQATAKSAEAIPMVASASISLIFALRVVFFALNGLHICLIHKLFEYSVVMHAELCASDLHSEHQVKKALGEGVLQRQPKFAALKLSFESSFGSQLPRRFCQLQWCVALAVLHIDGRPFLHQKLHEIDRLLPRVSP